MELRDISHCFVGVNSVLSILVIFITIAIMLFIGSSWTISTGFSGGGRIDVAKLKQTIDELRSKNKLTYKNLRKYHEIDNVTYVNIIHMPSITEKTLAKLLNDGTN
jgi:preprotein translocase subunit SecF